MIPLGGLATRQKSASSFWIIGVELGQTFGSSDRNYLHDYRIGDLTAPDMLTEVGTLRPDLEFFPETSIRRALFMQLAAIDGVSALPLLDGVPEPERRATVDRAVWSLINKGDFENVNARSVVELAMASPVDPTSPDLMSGRVVHCCDPNRMSRPPRTQQPQRPGLRIHPANLKHPASVRSRRTTTRRHGRN